MNEVPRGEVGQLAVRGPTGCRYLADKRQKNYVRDGWNLTGDTFMQDEEGLFHFVARADDMIISAGYNIAGPEVEAALLTHADVAECAVVGAPDDERGQIVAAYVVLKAGVARRRAASRACRTTSRRRSRPTNIRARCISSTPCRKRRPARSSVSLARAGPAMSDFDILQPPGWAAPHGYANGIAAEGRQVFIAGQIGWTADANW